MHRGHPSPPARDPTRRALPDKRAPRPCGARRAMRVASCGCRTAGGLPSRRETGARRIEFDHNAVAPGVVRQDARGAPVEVGLGREPSQPYTLADQLPSRRGAAEQRRGEQRGRRRA